MIANICDLWQLVFIHKLILRGKINNTRPQDYKISVFIFKSHLLGNGIFHQKSSTNPYCTKSWQR